MSRDLNRCKECAFFAAHLRACVIDGWEAVPVRPQDFACASFEFRPQDDTYYEGGDA